MQMNIVKLATCGKKQQLLQAMGSDRADYLRLIPIITSVYRLFGPFLTPPLTKTRYLRHIGLVVSVCNRALAALHPLINLLLQGCRMEKRAYLYLATQLCPLMPRNDWRLPSLALPLIGLFCTAVNRYVGDCPVRTLTLPKD